MIKPNNTIKRRAILGSSKGFTLLELLLYIAIVGSLLIAITGFYAMVAESRIKNQTISEVNQQGAAVMETITQAIRNANAITSPAAGASGPTLNLAMPTAGVNPTIFDLSGGGAVQIKEGIGAITPLTASNIQISNLIFKNLSRVGTPGVVQVTFTVSRVSSSGRNEYQHQKTFTSTAALR